VAISNTIRQAWADCGMCYQCHLSGMDFKPAESTMVITLDRRLLQQLLTPTTSIKRQKNYFRAGCRDSEQHDYPGS